MNRPAGATSPTSLRRRLTSVLLVLALVVGTAVGLGASLTVVDAVTAPAAHAADGDPGTTDPGQTKVFAAVYGGNTIKMGNGLSYRILQRCDVDGGCDNTVITFKRPAEASAANTPVVIGGTSSSDFSFTSR